MSLNTPSGIFVGVYQCFLVGLACQCLVCRGSCCVPCPARLAAHMGGYLSTAKTGTNMFTIRVNIRQIWKNSNDTWTLLHPWTGRFFQGSIFPLLVKGNYMQILKDEIIFSLSRKYSLYRTCRSLHPVCWGFQTFREPPTKACLYLHLSVQQNKHNVY